MRTMRNLEYIITMECRCGQYSVTNCQNVGAMLGCQCDVGLSVRCFRLRSSKIDVSTFENRCVDLRRSMCRLSKIDDRCVDLRGSMIDVSTFEDGWSMCRPSKIDGRCVDLRRPMIDVKLCCYTCSKHWWYSCMWIIAPRVCTSVLSL